MAANRIFSRLKTFVPVKTLVKEFSFKCFIFASWVPAIIFFNDHVAELASINGQSMYPYLNTGYNETLTKDLCLIDKRKPTQGLQRGMLVTFWSALPLKYIPYLQLTRMCIVGAHSTLKYSA